MTPLVFLGMAYILCQFPVAPNMTATLCAALALLMAPLWDFLFFALRK